MAIVSNPENHLMKLPNDALMHIACFIGPHCLVDGLFDYEVLPEIERILRTQFRSSI